MNRQKQSQENIVGERTKNLAEGMKVGQRHFGQAEGKSTSYSNPKITGEMRQCRNQQRREEDVSLEKWLCMPRSRGESPASGSWREKAANSLLPGAELRHELFSLASRFWTEKPSKCSYLSPSGLLLHFLPAFMSMSCSLFCCFSSRSFSAFSLASFARRIFSSVSRRFWFSLTACCEGNR